MDEQKAILRPREKLGLLQTDTSIYFSTLRRKSLIMKEESFYSSCIANIVFNAFLSYTAIMLNSITIYALKKTSSIPKPLKTLLLSLAVSDLGVGLVGQPLYVTRLVIEMEQDGIKNHPTLNTAVYVITQLCFIYATFFGVILLSLDRFLAIHLHLRYQELVTHKRVVATVISSWVFSAVVSLNAWRIPFFIHTGIVGAGILASGLLNWKIFVAARRHAYRRVLYLKQVEQLNIETANGRRRTKSAFTVIFVYVVFLVCYMPFICIRWFRNYEQTVVVKVLRLYISTLLFLNSSLNPLIYCWRMRYIRQAIMNMFQNAFRTSFKQVSRD